MYFNTVGLRQIVGIFGSHLDSSNRAMKRVLLYTSLVLAFSFSLMDLPDPDVFTDLKAGFVGADNYDACADNIPDYDPQDVALSTHLRSTASEFADARIFAYAVRPAHDKKCAGIFIRAPPHAPG